MLINRILQAKDVKTMVIKTFLQMGGDHEKHKGITHNSGCCGPECSGMLKKRGFKRTGGDKD
jgi:hypothetical protein